ncbi:hypothetical protein FUAX_14810 [Fulvitalea axinellae]|uniref:Uncharacterized protein n=1 Tax=Fulvitalea axinellae TaxID=1182444 RepID=A0AAU9D3P7_9BACT|nr:hypothetical protein FUAX_14810 [Fulvitalea axinellae]
MWICRIFYEKKGLLFDRIEADVCHMNEISNDKVCVWFLIIRYLNHKEYGRFFSN